jgi:hypothetical protein
LRKLFVFSEGALASVLRFLSNVRRQPGGQEAHMKKSVRVAIGSAALAIGIAAAAPANAQVRFEGSFPSPVPLPRISVGVPGLSFSIGTYVPQGFNVYADPDYGYGFAYGDQWIPCEQRGGGWVVIGRPVFFGRRGFASVRPYQGYRYGLAGRDRSFGRSIVREGRGFSNDGRFAQRGSQFRDNRGLGREGRGFSNDSRFAQRSQQFRDNRGFGREGRSAGNSRSNGRGDRGSRGSDRRSGR